MSFSSLNVALTADSLRRTWELTAPTEIPPYLERRGRTEGVMEVRESSRQRVQRVLQKKKNTEGFHGLKSGNKERLSRIHRAKWPGRWRTNTTGHNCLFMSRDYNKNTSNITSRSLSAPHNNNPSWQVNRFILPAIASHKYLVFPECSKVLTRTSVMFRPVKFCSVSVVFWILWGKKQNETF